MCAAPVTLVVHGHFYQPPRENPWTGEVAREPSAAPFHDWNERVSAECYRPNAFARILDDHGRIVGICNTFERLSFDVGPTLMSWLEVHQPDAYRRIVAAGRGGAAIAQAFSHLILPLATERDIRTQVRWGLADFRHRFGRPARGMWLPETAVNDTVLAILAEEEVGFTILAPYQAARVRPLTDRDDGRWEDTHEGSLDTRRTYRWHHPTDAEVGLDVVFYHGGLSHAAAFELPGLSSQALIDRVVDAAGPDGGLVMLATDGETFGHHHHWGDRLLAYALEVEAPRRHVEVADVASFLDRNRPAWQVEIKESAWSCAHGVDRWRRDCGCSTGGGPGWTQGWRAPLRSALDGLRDRAGEIFERRGRTLFAAGEPWAARDAYVDVVLGAQPMADFVADWLKAGTDDDRVDALTLLEAQRHTMAMYTSCGWFFNDLAGLETVQVLRYAARVMDLLAELGEDAGEAAFLAELAGAESNVAEEGDGRRIWIARVAPARVDPGRVVAHLALLALLDAGDRGDGVDRGDPGDRGEKGDRGGMPAQLASHAVEPVDDRLMSRGAVALASGRVVLRHDRTGRRSEHVYAAIRLGGLEVLGAVRGVPSLSEKLGAGGDDAAADAGLRRLREAFAGGARLTTLLRLVTDGFGPREFGLSDALPDAAERLMANAGAALADRFADACQRLFDENRTTLESLAALGEPLPPVLRQPAELALARRFEAELAAQAGSLDVSAYHGAMALIAQARAAGLRISTPSTLAAGERLLGEAVGRAVETSRAARSPRRATGGPRRVAGGVRRVVDGPRAPVEGGRRASDPVLAEVISSVHMALGLLDLAADLDLAPSLDRSQEVVYDALLDGSNPELRRLGTALGLAVEALGPPFP